MYIENYDVIKLARLLERYTQMMYEDEDTTVEDLVIDIRNDYKAPSTEKLMKAMDYLEYIYDVGFSPTEVIVLEELGLLSVSSLADCYDEREYDIVEDYNYNYCEEREDDDD